MNTKSSAACLSWQALQVPAGNGLATGFPWRGLTELEIHPTTRVLEAGLVFDSQLEAGILAVKVTPAGHRFTGTRLAIIFQAALALVEERANLNDLCAICELSGLAEVFESRWLNVNTVELAKIGFAAVQRIRREW